MIDYQALHAIFGDTLPEAHTFFATRSNKFASSYAALRRDLGMTRARTNRAVWLRFVEKYKKETATPVVPVTSIAITPATASVAKGGTQQFTVVVSPANATDKSYTLSTSNNGATITPQGLLTVDSATNLTTVRVDVVSNADASKNAFATVTITAAQGA